MNYTTAVFLINSNVRALLCTLEPTPEARKRMFKTLDKTVAVGDYVVVPADQHHKMAVCKVTDADVDVDFDNSTLVEWIIAKVDLAPHCEVGGMEAQAIAAIKSAEMTKKRNELRAALLADSAGALKALPITVMHEGPALPVPAANLKRKKRRMTR